MIYRHKNSELNKTKYTQMKDILKYAGVIAVLIGAIVLIIPGLMHTTSNGTLTAAGIFLVVGFIAHIVINRFVVK